LIGLAVRTRSREGDRLGCAVAKQDVIEKLAAIVDVDSGQAEW
jgi:hypothetical protein